MAIDQNILRPKRYPETTKCKTVSSFFKLYAGPEYDIAFKYAEIQFICTICFMFGQGIPVLFPLGLISLIVIFIIERIGLAKVYKKPP